MNTEETVLKINFEEDPVNGLAAVISPDRQHYLERKAAELVKQMTEVAHRENETSITDMMYLVATMILNIVVNSKQFTSPNQFVGGMNMFYKMILQAFLTGGIKIVAEGGKQ